MDSSSDYSSSAWDGARDEPDAAIVAHWPDGTAITEAQWRAPSDPRELLQDQRRYFRRQRWVHQRLRIGQALSSLGSPRGMIATLLAGALLAVSVVTTLGAIR